MYKIYKKNNYIVIDDDISAPEWYLSKDILVQEIVENVSYEIFGILPKLGNFTNQLLHKVSIPNILKENGSPYTATEWIDFYTANSGILSSNINTNSFGYDAGGRTRISQITTLLDGKNLGIDDTLAFENVGTGTASFSNNKTTLSVTLGQYKIRQTKRFFPYFSGKGQLVECTFDGFQTEANVVKRIGYFSTSVVAPYTASTDGFYIEDNGTIKVLKIFRSGTETASVDFTAMDNYAAISSYNWTNFSVVAFDFLWLGGAILRFWVKTSAGFVLVHTVNYSGSAVDTFTLSPNQPLRYEIRSSTGTGSLRYICSQVATEGSVNESGKPLTIFNTTSITCNTVGTIYALKSIKKQATYRDTAIQIVNVAVGITATSDAGLVMLFVNPTLSTPINYINKEKIQEGTATNQTITANTGRLIACFPISASGTDNSMKDSYYSFLSGLINNTMDEYVLAYMPTTLNQTVNGIISIKEI